MIKRIKNISFFCFFIAIGLGVICMLLDQAFKNDTRNFGPIDLHIARENIPSPTVSVIRESALPIGSQSANAVVAVDIQPTERPIAAQPVKAVPLEHKTKPVKKVDENHVRAVYAGMILEDQPKLSLKTAESWASTIREEEQKNNLPAGLTLAVIHTESWHDPKAVSSCGALGLMQVMPPTAKDFAPKVGVWQAPAEKKLPEKASWKAKNDAKKAFAAASKKADKQLAAKLHEPTSNIKVGSKVLAAYLESEGSLPKALKKYSGDATDYHKKVSEYRQTILARLESQSQDQDKNN